MTVGTSHQQSGLKLPPKSRRGTPKSRTVDGSRKTGVGRRESVAVELEAVVGFGTRRRTLVQCLLDVGSSKRRIIVLAVGSST